MTTALIHPDVCQTYHIEWTLDYTNWSDVRQFANAANSLSGRSIYVNILWRENKAIWTQVLPVTHGHIIVNGVDQVAQLLARRFGIQLLHPRLAQVPARL